LSEIFSTGMRAKHSASQEQETGHEPDLEIEAMKVNIAQLQLDNARLLEDNLMLDAEKEKTKKLRGEIDSLKEEIKALQYEVRSKDDQLKRMEHSRNMLLGKVGESDSTRMEKVALENDIEILRTENSELRRKLNDSERLTESHQIEVGILKEDLRSLQSDMDRARMEYESKCRELSSFRESERGALKWEEQAKRSDEQIRALQSEALDRLQAESRLKTELSAADARCAQLESENASLRRRVMDTAETRDREVSQYQSRVISLEGEIRGLSDDLVRARRAAEVHSASNRMEPTYYTPTAVNYYAAPPVPDMRQANPSSYGVSRTTGARDDYQHDHNATRSRYCSLPGGLTDRYLDPPLDAKQGELYAPTTKSSQTAGKVSTHSLRGALVHSLDVDRDVGTGIERSRDNSHHEAMSGRAPVTRSLASLIGGGGVGNKSVPSVKNVPNKPRGAGVSPFATEATSDALRSFEEMERELTSYMTEKTALEEELARLHQRGGRTLKDRTRTTQVEGRLGDLSKDIARIRRDLATKPS